MDLTNIDWLFDEFADGWDEQWTRKLVGVAKNKKDKWAQVLTGRSREELQQALDKAIVTLPLPPTIADFIKLLPVSPVIEGWSHATSIEMADKKLKRLMPKKYVEVEMLRFIFRDLEQKIYGTRSEHCDFAVCVVDDCYHYEIFDKPYLGQWLCQKHFKG